MQRRRAGLKHPSSQGQVLVLFVLFLLVLLAVSALGIDYANWLLNDRSLQNVSDHAALAGASEFDLRLNGSCGGAPTKCVSARAQAWKSLANDLNLKDSANADLGDPAIQALAANNSPASGQASGTYGGQAIVFNETIWVSTPPPNYAAYTAAGGRYTLNYGVVFVRVDRPVTAFLSGAIGIRPSIRTGWATAGALPTDYALEVFCRNQIAPQSGVCDNSAGLTVDGQGGIHLVRGDIGSNESLTVSSQTGSGVIVEAGNMFLVNRTCASSTWNCPRIPATTGGISDADPVANPGTANAAQQLRRGPDDRHNERDQLRRRQLERPVRPVSTDRVNVAGRLDLPHDWVNEPMWLADGDRRDRPVHRPGWRQPRQPLLPGRDLVGRGEHFRRRDPPAVEWK
jgi:Putative Flp pilus-assembly TadE/G-like